MLVKNEPCFLYFLCSRASPIRRTCVCACGCACMCWLTNWSVKHYHLLASLILGLYYCLCCHTWCCFPWFLWHWVLTPPLLMEPNSAERWWHFFHSTLLTPHFLPAIASVLSISGFIPWLPSHTASLLDIYPSLDLGSRELENILWRWLLRPMWLVY